MIRVLRAIVFFVLMIAYCVDMMLRGARKSAHERMKFIASRQRKGCKVLTRGLRISTEVIGSLPEDKAFLIVSNHIGTLDPWILASNFDVAFVAKSEMGTWPVIGWVCKAVGIIFAHRKNVMKTASTVDEIRDRMRAGVAVLVFPEGTTSDGTEILPFKTGGFEAVSGMEDGFVVPIYFHVRQIKSNLVDLESRRVVTWSSPQTMASNLWQVLGLGKLHFVIRIGDPISSVNKDRKQLAQQAQAEVERMKKLEERDIAGSKTLVAGL